MQDSERARALEQARETALRTDVTYLSPSGRRVRVQGHKLTGRVIFDSRGRAAVRNVDTDRLSYVYEADLRELAVDPPPSGASPQAETSGYIDIVFDGPSSHVSGWFIEVENVQGASISVGKWVHRTDGYWALRLPAPVSPVEPPSEDEDDDVPLLAPEGAMDSWSAPLRKPVPLKILSTDDFYALLRILEVLPADPFLSALQAKLSDEERRQHGNQASHLSGPEFVREIERVEALIQSRVQPPALSPVEPEPPTLEPCAHELDYHNCAECVGLKVEPEPPICSDPHLLKRGCECASCLDPVRLKRQLLEVWEKYRAFVDAVASALHVESERGPVSEVSVIEAARDTLNQLLDSPTVEPEPCVWREKYNELLFAVERAYPGESRHETALRYIREKETVESCAPKAPLKVEREP